MFVGCSVLNYDSLRHPESSLVQRKRKWIGVKSFIEQARRKSSWTFSTSADDNMDPASEGKLVFFSASDQQLMVNPLLLTV